MSGRQAVGMNRFVGKDNIELEKAHLSILQWLTIVWPFIEQHINEICAQTNGRSEDWIIKEQKLRFPSWFRDKKMVVKRKL